MGMATGPSSAVDVSLGCSMAGPTWPAVLIECV